MKLTIELHRVGTSRSSVSLIPIVARVKMSGTYGTDLLAGMGISDVEQAKLSAVEKLDRLAAFRGAKITWIDRTNE